MNTINISQKTKNKHLDFSHYEYIINSLIMFNASYSGKRNIGKTQFLKNLALDVGTSVSNIYSIIKDATVSIRDTHLNEHFELSALAAFQKRSKNHKIPNNSKFDKATDFISLVENEIKSNRLSSIDETINYLIIHQRDKINDMETNSSLYSEEQKKSALLVLQTKQEQLNGLLETQASMVDTSDVAITNMEHHIGEATSGMSPKPAFVGNGSDFRIKEFPR